MGATIRIGPHFTDKTRRFLLMCERAKECTHESQKCGVDVAIDAVSSAYDMHEDILDYFPEFEKFVNQTEFDEKTTLDQMHLIHAMKRVHNKTWDGEDFV